MQVGSRQVGRFSVWTLEGRLDASGAGVLDERVEAMAPGCRWLALDMAGVSFLSSMGIRSLLVLDRRLRERDGALLLCSVQPFVLDLLRMAGLADLLSVAGSVDDALQMLEAACEAAGSCETLSLGGCSLRVRRLPDGDTTGTVWRRDGVGEGAAMTAVHLDELGPAFGVGGFGVNRSEAADARGLFLSTGRAVAMCPADGRNVTDLLMTALPERTLLYVDDAMGLPEGPTHALEAPDFEGTLRELLEVVGEWLDNAPFSLTLLAESVALTGRFFRTASDIEQGEWSRREVDGALAALVLGCSVGEGTFEGHALLLDRETSGFPRELGDLLTEAADADSIRYLLAVDPGATRVRAPRLWVNAPLELEDGRSRQLTVEAPPGASLPDEWEVIVRRTYRDAGRVSLRSLSGGYTATTFQVESEDSTGRRMIPTVLKIAPLAMTAREERAYHDFVERFILNNSTVIMGGAEQGDWSGLRYNFVGVNGPESRLTWLARHYSERPVAELEPLWEALFLSVLWPWYGQSDRRTVRPFVDHDPAGLFGRLAEDAREALGIEPDAGTVDCPELGCVLPNPYLFHASEFDRRRDLTREWRTSITHGDLNLNNVLLDEKENIYVIDFSETAVRSVVSDFARLEPLLAIQMTRMENERDAAGVLQLWEGLLDVDPLADMPQLNCAGYDPSLRKACETIRLLRGYAARAAGDMTDPLAYWMPLLQWTLPMVSFAQLPLRYKRVSMVVSAMICRRIIEALGAEPPD